MVMLHGNKMTTKFDTQITCVAHLTEYIINTLHVYIMFATECSVAKKK